MALLNMCKKHLLSLMPHHEARACMTAHMTSHERSEVWIVGQAELRAMGYAYGSRWIHLAVE